MTKENLIVFIDSVMESGRKIVITSLFLLGTFFAASLSYQSEATLKQINTESISLSSQDAENLMQLVLDGVLLISVITIAIYVLALKIRPENFKDFILIAKRNKLKVFGFLTACLLLFLLPYNILTMGAVLLTDGIWRETVKMRERINSCQERSAVTKKREEET